MKLRVAIRPVALSLWIILVGNLARADEPATAPAIGVWELPQAAGFQARDLAARQGWKPLVPGTAKAPLDGGLAIENQALLTLIPAGQSEIVLFTKGEGKAVGVRQTITLLGRNKPAGKLGGIQLVDYDEGEVVASFTAGDVAARLKLGLGKCFVEVLPGKHADGRAGPQPGAGSPSSLTSSAATYSSMPTRPPRPRSSPRRRTSSSILLDGHAALSMITWPQDGGEDVLLVCEDTVAGRRFTATQVSFNGKSVFVALVARKGTWFEKDLRAAKKDTTLMVEGWQPPFPAKWMTLLAKRPAVGATSGITSETLPVPLLPPGGDTPYSDVYVHPHVPSWFSGPPVAVVPGNEPHAHDDPQDGRLARLPAGDQLPARPRETDAAERRDAGGRDARHAGHGALRIHPRPGRAQQDPQHGRGGHGQAHGCGHLLGARRTGLLLPGRAGGKPSAR